MSTPTSPPSTFTFDPTHGTELDVYLPPLTDAVPSAGAGGDGQQQQRPLVVYFHGGGMTGGGKRDALTPDWLPKKVLSRGHVLISANYRLLYPSTPQDLIDDVHILFRYLTASASPFASTSTSSASSSGTELGAHLAAHGLTIDLARLVVFGNSGGNYLARAAAVLPSVQPRPVAWLSVNGMGGDFLLDHWVQPKDVIKITFLAKEQNKVDKLLAADGGPVSTDAALGFIPHLKQVGDATGRVGLFVYFYWKGLLLDYLLNEPGLSEKVRAIPYDYEKRLEAIPQEKRHLLLPLHAQVPPTFQVHGTVDVVVPCAESERTHAVLTDLGVPNEFGRVQGADHGLRDPALPPPARKEGWEEVVDRAFAFMDECVSAVQA